MAGMIERVARAIDPSVWENWDNWVGLKGYTADEAAEEFARSPSLHKSLERARDALEAMREPTPEMLDVALPERQIELNPRVSTALVFRDMIDAALTHPE